MDGRPDSAKPGIVLDGVTKTYEGTSVAAVAPLDLHLGAGELTVLIGPSGCGKTTTLQMINRLIEPTAGSISIDGVDIKDRSLTDLRRNIGYVIQQVGLFPHRSVAQNIATVPKLLGWDKARIAGRVTELVDMVGIDRRLMTRYPSELSGGQQQRVGVARALASDPPVLLMDEPFGAVDPIVRARLQRELRSLQAELRKTIVMVTHDLDEAIALADRIVLLREGGFIEQFDTPDELLANPTSSFVEDFLGRDRSIRRLALGTVGDLDLGSGPIVAVDADRAAMDHAIRAASEGWVGLTDGDTFLGWVTVQELTDHPASALTPAPPAATVTSTTSLRETLDVILTARTSAAVVIDDGHFRGTVSLENIRRGLTK